MCTARAATISIFVNAGNTTAGTAAGDDIVDGGSETVGGKDTLIVSNVTASSSGNALDPGDFGDPATTTSGNPSATPVTFTMTPDSANTVIPTDGVDLPDDIRIAMTQTVGGAAVGTIVADEIEDVQFNLGSGGDTVNISGDFSNTSLEPNTITINGGVGNDTVNAGGLTSAHDIVFYGNGGDDTFTSGAGDDTFVGGTGTDKVVFTAAFDPADLSFSGNTLTYGGDTVSGTEVLEFSDGTLLIVDQPGGADYDGAYGTIAAALAAANAITGPGHDLRDGRNL